MNWINLARRQWVCGAWRVINQNPSSPLNNEPLINGRNKWNDEQVSSPNYDNIEWIRKPINSRHPHTANILALKGRKSLCVDVCPACVTVVGAAHGLSITECLWPSPGPIWQQGPPSLGDDFSFCVFVAHVSQLWDEILSHSPGLLLGASVHQLISVRNNWPFISSLIQYFN